LNELGLKYEYKYVNQKINKRLYKDGTIVFIKRCKRYPFGHYLIRHNNKWMDPWINLPFDKDISNAKSGFRKRLPATPIYAILPI
jgi:hypothetical protein